MLAAEGVKAGVSFLKSKAFLYMIIGLLIFTIFFVIFISRKCAKDKENKA